MSGGFSVVKHAVRKRRSESKFEARVSRSSKQASGSKQWRDSAGLRWVFFSHFPGVGDAHWRFCCEGVSLSRFFRGGGGAGGGRRLLLLLFIVVVVLSAIFLSEGDGEGWREGGGELYSSSGFVSRCRFESFRIIPPFFPKLLYTLLLFTCLYVQKPVKRLANIRDTFTL